jgi:phosphoserine phosphatase RsbU/P
MLGRVAHRTDVGYFTVFFGVGVITAVFAPLHATVNSTTAALAYLLLVLSVATIWGRTPAMVASVLATVCFDFLILPPFFSFAAADPQNLLAVAAFLLTAITAGNLSERSKRLAAAYSRNLIEAGLDPLAAIGPDGRITDANAAMEHVTGYSRASLIGSDFSSYFTDPDQARIGYQQVFREGSVRNYALDLRHRDGHIASVLYSASVLRDSGGRVSGAVAEARDITEWKRAEDQFRHLARLQAETAELAQLALRRPPLTDLLNDATARVARGLGVEYSNIAEMLPGGEALLLRAGVGWETGLVGSTTVKRPGSQSGYAILSPGPVIVEDAAAETRFIPLTRALGAEAASAMSVAITSAEGPYGSLGAHSRARRTFTPDEVNFLETAANVVGMAIERERGEERLRRINRAHSALSMTNQALVRITDESALLQQICEVIVEEAEYRLCWVGYAEQDAARSVRVVAQAGFDEGYLQAAKITWGDTVRGRGPTGACIRTGDMQIVKDVASDPRLAPWRADAAERGYASSIAIPLMSEGVPFGALTIYSSEIAAFAEEEVQLLTELAEDLGYGIVTLRMQAGRRTAEAEAVAREHETAIGFRIQQMLLLDAEPTGIRNLRVAAQSIPSQRVAGDFYQFFTHRDESVDIIVADVMGKGVPAALLGAATKSRFIEALCHLMALSPSGVLPEPRDIVTLAHSDMAQHLIELESFVTLCYARVNLGRQRLDLVDCGHTGLIHLRGGAGECEIVHGDNLPLGIRDGEIFNQIAVHIEAGDVVLFYSDGITEASSKAGELFGTERLTDCVRSNAALGPEALVDAILAAVTAFAGSDRLTDDRTCVAIAIGEQSSALSCQEVEISSDLHDLRRARAFVRGFCGGLPGSWLDRNGIAELELAVSEAASNVMRHAYQGRTDQHIQIEAEAFPDYVAIRLHHLGDPFDPAAAPAPSLDGSRESGFGVYLITHSVDEFRYYRDERGGSCIALIKKRKG